MLDPFKITYKKTEDGWEISYTGDEVTEVEKGLLEDILKEFTDGKQWNTTEMIAFLQRVVWKVWS